MAYQKHLTPLRTGKLCIDTIPFIKLHQLPLSAADFQLSSRQLIHCRIYTLVSRDINKGTKRKTRSGPNLKYPEFLHL
mgnify:CR=1 FL=1